MGKKSVEKSGNIVINTKAVRISNNSLKSKKKVKHQKKKSVSNREINIALIENFVMMQKVLTNLTARFEMMSDNISRLLNLFELSAKSFMEKHDNGSLGAEDEKGLLKKLDIILEQNKTVAKGVTLIEEKIRHKIYGEMPKPGQNLGALGIGEKPRPKPLPKI